MNWQQFQKKLKKDTDKYTFIVLEHQIKSIKERLPFLKDVVFEKIRPDPIPKWLLDISIVLDVGGYSCFAQVPKTEEIRKKLEIEQGQPIGNKDIVWGYTPVGLNGESTMTWPI